jgi:hypothetical protein
MKATTSQSGKKRYETPVLSVYGDIRDVTQAVGSTMSLDGSSVSGMTMTAL